MIGQLDQRAPEERPATTALSSGEPSFWAQGMLAVVLIAFAKFLLHMYFNNRYDYFRDEFDYMACGNHPAWGYVDQPPLIPALVRISRFLGWCYAVAYTVFIVLHGKNYYLAPIYPMLLAAGAVTMEAAIEKWKLGWLRPATLAILLVTGALSAPVVVPIIPIDQFGVYLSKLPFKVPASEHSHIGAALPQHYADQFGWREIVAETATAFNRLSPNDRSGCAVFVQDYGQAGAIDFFGPQYGLPPALSGHQTYYLWGPRGYSGNCMIVLDDQKEVLEGLFEKVEYVGTSEDNPYAQERNIPVFICRGARFGMLEQIWPRLKKWR